VTWPEAFTRNTPAPEVEVELLVEELLDVLDELLDEDELEELLEAPELEEELLDDELELEVEPELLMPPVEAVSVTRSSRAPSSRLTILRV
jgi:hypothetical protein